MAFGAIGTGMQTPTATLTGTMNAITEKFIYPVIADNVFQPSILFWAMQRQGKKFGMGELIYPAMYQENLAGGAYYGAEILTPQVVDTVQPIDQVWKPYYQNVSIPVTDIILNRGSAMDIINTKWIEATGSLLQKLSRAMWHTAPQNTTQDVDDISSWVYSTTNTIGGINRATAANSWFKAQAPINAGSTAMTPTVANQGFGATGQFGYDLPDIFVFTPTSFYNFQNAFTQNIRYTGNIQDEGAMQAGFRSHFLFNTAMVFPDPFVPTGYAFLLNSKYIFPVWHKGDYFQCDPFIQPSNQRVLVSNLYVTWQISCISPRMNESYYNVD
jgi:hypothetical protein